jgi:APA family basic amino acid/polyamine antiporter
MCYRTTTAAITYFVRRYRLLHDGRVSDATRPQLVRVIGRWSLTALVLNGILGSGIFGLPAPLAAAVGRASPWAALVAGAAMAVIGACYAEVASQFSATGGTYLYVRCALGRFAGLQAGWMSLLVRLAAGAASLNLLVEYLAEFWPAATQALPRLTIITAFLGVLTLINYRGARVGAGVSTITAAAKVLGLGLVCAVGTIYLVAHPSVPQALPATSVDQWLRGILLLFFSYGGYEIALIASGEARNPRRDAPFAVFAGLLTVALLYTLLQATVMRVVPDPAHSSRPLADAARVLMGRPGAMLISAAAILSVSGFLSANLLAMPRSMFALATLGEFPRQLAAVHPKYRTPYVSIAAFAFVTWVAALFGSFSWNVTLSAVARLLYFAAICASVPALRKKQPAAATFRVPGGALFPVAGIAICGALLTRIDLGNSLILVATVTVALVNWIMTRRSSAGEFAGAEP